MPTESSNKIKEVLDFVSKQVSEHNSNSTGNSSLFTVTDREFNTLKNGFFFEINNTRVIEVFVTNLGDIKLTEEFAAGAEQKRVAKNLSNGKLAKEFISVLVKTNKSNSPLINKKINDVTFVVVDPDDLNHFNIFNHL
ncbi:hypothetical protein NYE47_00870 [Paenibacillus sp. FSL H7-0941]|uniref:hypothetical protein n=1 Tax=unclassified Paenibacillus TaxID=185978 RepID=UPI0030F58E94